MRRVRARKVTGKRQRYLEPAENTPATSKRHAGRLDEIKRVMEKVYPVMKPGLRA